MPRDSTHRVRFTDEDGTAWAARVHSDRKVVLGLDRASVIETRESWLLFESPDEIRRLTPVPERWTMLGERDLRELLRTATLYRLKR